MQSRINSQKLLKKEERLKKTTPAREGKKIINQAALQESLFVSRAKLAKVHMTTAILSPKQ